MIEKKRRINGEKGQKGQDKAFYFQLIVFNFSNEGLLLF